MASAPVQQNYMVPSVVRPTYVAQVPQNYLAPPVVQPAYLAQAQAQTSLSGVMDEQAFNASVARAMVNLMNTNTGVTEQFVTTRGGRDSVPQSGQGF
jgi:hypothetical protein